MKKICCISTISGTLEDFVIPAMDEFIALGYEVTLISSMTDSFLTKYSHKYKCVHWGMSRGVSLYDIIVMPWKFRKIFKEEQFDLVQYCTPNASFYASIGAKLAGVSKRLYCQWGIRYVGANGIMRSLLKTIEKITCRLSTHIRCASKKIWILRLRKDYSLRGKQV